MGLVRRMQKQRRYRDKARRRWLRRGEAVFVACWMVLVAVLIVVRVSSPRMTGVSGDSPLPPSVATGRIPPVAGVRTGTYAFIETTADGRPVTYDPCVPIHYVINPNGMPQGGLNLVHRAVAEISAASGLAFAEDGVTLEAPSVGREPRQPARYGDRWAPVLIGWTDGTSFPPLSGYFAGVAGSSVLAPQGPGSERYVTGEVALNRDWFAKVLTRPGGDVYARVVIMHELGHLVGLAHVNDPGEVMAESDSAATKLGPGDRQGLAAVGAGRCGT